MTRTILQLVMEKRNSDLDYITIILLWGLKKIFLDIKGLQHNFLGNYQKCYTKRMGINQKRGRRSTQEIGVSGKQKRGSLGKGMQQVQRVIRPVGSRKRGKGGGSLHTQNKWCVWPEGKHGQLSKWGKKAINSRKNERL